MSVDGVLALGRAAAEQLLRDACLIERKDGPPVLNTLTGQNVQEWVTVYTGRCRVKTVGQGSESEYGEREVTLHRYAISLPWDTTAAVRREDRLTVTACGDDPQLVGRQLEVIDVAYSGTATVRRLVAEDRTG